LQSESNRMDEKIDPEQVDDQAREREASELQAQIDEIISGKGDTEVKPKTLRDLTRPVRKDSIPTPCKGSEEPVQNNESEVKND
jgi:hypothetical protein